MSTITGDRTKVSIAIGTDDIDELEAYTQEVAAEISDLAGGCQLLKGRGFWTEDGNASGTTDRGQLADEATRVIEFVDDKPEDQLLDLITDLLKTAANNYNAPGQQSIEWINVETSRVAVNHVNVQA